MPELLEYLKRLAREYRNRKKVLDEAGEDVKWGKPHELCESLNGCWDALAHLSRWIHDRTGIPVYDLQEAAFRAGSAFGLAAYQVPLLPMTTMEPVDAPDLPEACVPSVLWTKHAIETRENSPEILERRDLTAILPKLAELDRDPATAPRVFEILAQHPGIVEALGITEPQATTVTPQPRTAKCVVTWKKARKLAETHCSRNPFPGVNALAKIVGCAASTMSKAIDQSDKLRKMASDCNAQRKTVAAVEMTEAAAESAVQTREVSPEEGASRSTEAILARLLDEATPAERAKINAMAPEEWKELVANVAYDPDYHELDKSPRVRGYSR